MVKGLVYGLVLGLIMALIIGLMSLVQTLGGGPAKDMIKAFVYPLSSGLYFGLIGGFVYGLIMGFYNVSSIPKIKSPYQALLAQFWSDILQWMVILGFTFGVGFYIVSGGSSDGFAFGILFGGFMAMPFSLIFRHLCLRFALLIEKAVPLRLVTFLNAVSDTGLMTKGRWPVAISASAYS